MIAKAKAFAVLIILGVFILSIALSPFALYVLFITILSKPFPALRTYAKVLWIAADQTVNASTGGNMDHTISGRIGYNAILGNKTALELEKVVDFIFWKNHCREAVEKDEAFSQDEIVLAYKQRHILESRKKP